MVLLLASLLALNNLFLNNLSSGIGLYGGLFHVTSTTQIFHIFIFVISALILQLTAFYPRKVWIPEYSSLNKLALYQFMYYKTRILNKMGEQFKILEYPVRQSGKLFTLRGKLSNSGDLLKLLVPNLVELYHGGWTNHSGTETSQKMTLHILGLTKNITSGIYPGLCKGWKNPFFFFSRKINGQSRI